MSIPRSPDPAKLVIGVFMQEKALLEGVAASLTDILGPIDGISPWFSFDYTNYYEPEMGAPLFRRLFSFEKLIRQRMLARIKLKTNAIETRYAVDRRRRINIDPGYMLHSQFVLATGKNYTHRIYIGRGIYADLTLIYNRGGFTVLPWTYPDYADPQMIEYLQKVRQKYVLDMRAGSGSMQPTPASKQAVH